MKYIVYQTTCKVNNKIYIGVHGTEQDGFDGYIGNGVSIYRPAAYLNPKTPFQCAVKKDGVKNFIKNFILSVSIQNIQFLEFRHNLLIVL